MTPISGFLERYFGRKAAPVILCVLYGTMIIGCCMTIGYSSNDPMPYVNLR